MASKTTRLLTRRAPRSNRNGSVSVVGPTKSHTSARAQDFLKRAPDEQLALVIRDYEAAYAALAEGRLAKYAGQYVAFSDGDLVGCGKEPEKLRSRLSQKLGVHREQMAVIHVKDVAIL